MAELPIPDHGVNEASTLADEILRRPEFQRPEPSALDRAMGWVSHQIGKLFQFAGESGLGTVLAAFMVAGAIVGIVVLISRLFTGRITRPASDHPIEATVAVRSPEDASHWRRLAQEHAAAGRWRDAVRCRYRAMAAELADRKVIGESDAATTGEERVQVAERAPRAVTPFSDVTSVFDEIWYGGAQADASVEARVSTSADETIESIR